MNRLYQESGHELFAAGHDLERAFGPEARPRRKNGRRAYGSQLDPTHTPRLSMEPSDVEYRAVLRPGEVNVGRTVVLLRLLRLLFHGLYFWAGVLLRRLNRQEPEERVKANAKKFRALLENLGGVMIKVGQQLSQRPDILPAAYCDELKTLLDELKTLIPRKTVIDTIERQLGRGLWDVFAEFRFDPVVGSASVACVYRAVLQTGEEVAVKVRRPGIQRAFTADLEAIDWLFFTFEFLTIWRPGTTRHIAVELKDLLLEELDFRREARYQELFRRYHKRRKKLRVTAPKVYYGLSGEEVMVSELVEGRKVQEIIEAIDANDEVYLEELRRDNICPKKVAQRLVRSRYYSFHECPLFHGDPHPNNIIVQPGSHVVMLDFGACGVFSNRDRNLMWQMNYYYAREDVAGMVNMVLLLMEPIHPINIHPFKRELQDAWWTGFYGIKSKHAQWWERSSLRLWLRFYELIRKYQLPIPRNMVRMIRATLLYDTVAARLYSKVNIFREFQKYERGVAKRVRREIQESAVRQLLLGPDNENYLRMQQVWDLGNDILAFMRRFFDNQDFVFQELPGKIYSAIREIVRMIGLSAIAAAAAAVVAGAIYVFSIWKNYPNFNWATLLNPVNWAQNQAYYLYTVEFVGVVWVVFNVVFIFAYARRIYLRFGDVDD
ncbi:MAG: AarF/ABC1/UbiB kinase family protein [Acidobacteria bacterium]|nr:AarF/ABC1/UbiB kinase family protein [Acidobacteriota bacterium]